MRVRELALRSVKALSIVTDPLTGGRRPGPRILIYHQVGAASGLEMDVPSERFRSQMEWLKENGRVIDLREALSSTSGDDYVLTFDDGHLGLYDSAFPTMVELALPFTLYISSGPVDQGGYLHDDQRMPLLSWRQIEEMMGSGLMTLGAHTHSHLDLTRHDVATIEPDVIKCDELLEQHTGTKPRHFAYPWGKWSEAADGLIRARYESAVIGSGRGLDHTRDLHALSRIPVMASDGDLHFSRRMWGGFRLESTLRGIRDARSSPQ